MEKKIDNFFSEKLSILILLLVSLITIVLVKQIYTFENEILSDAAFYIATSEDLKNYFTIPHQNALRIFPSILVYLLKFFGISTDNCFKFLSIILFIFLHLKTFYLLKSYKVNNYLALSSIAILFYSNHSIIYLVFNYYQMIDLIVYILIIYFIQLNRTYNLKILFFVSLISIFTKEYLLIIVCSIYLKYFINYKNKKICLSFILILIIFFAHYQLASSNNLEVKEHTNLIWRMEGYFNNDKNYLFYFKSIFDGMIIQKNIFLLIPFSILLFSRNFLKLLIENYAMTIFTIVPIFFGIFYFQLVGNNFFRVFYQGYFILIFLSILFLNKLIFNQDNLKILFFISPLFFIIDFVYILININQDGFFNFFQSVRYDYLSGYYIFNLIIILIFLKCFKNIFLKNYNLNIKK